MLDEKVNMWTEIDTKRVRI